MRNLRPSNYILIQLWTSDRAIFRTYEWAIIHLPAPLLGFAPLKHGHGLSIQQQLYERICAAVADGRLRPGGRLPSARSLAAQLGVARGTVDAVYARLAGEGYVLSRGPAGTVVSPGLQAAAVPAAAAAVATTPGTAKPAESSVTFDAGLPALDLFPRVLWARLSTRSARRLAGPGLAYPDPAGLPALREAVAAYLAVSRGVACQPAQVVVTGAYQGAVALVARLLLRPGDPVWFEDPGYAVARRALEAAGVRIVPVPVDSEGMQVAEAQERCPEARLAVVTPAHHFPSSVTLSLARRQALLAWAAKADAWILEDDYDSEFHYVGHKPSALKSLDRADRVLFAGTFSKTLFPGLRLGYLVLPAQLVKATTAASGLLHNGQGVLEQSVVAAFMAEGHFARHLRRMRTRYAARRSALADALTDGFPGQVRLAPQPGGLHLLARFPGRERDTELVRRARNQGLAPTALSTQAVEHEAEQGLLLGFTNIPEAKASEAVAALRRAIG